MEPKLIENCDHDKLVRIEDEPRVIDDGTPFWHAQCVQCGGRANVPEHETSSPGPPAPAGTQETLDVFGGSD